MRPDYIWHVALGAGMGTRERRDHLSDAQLAGWHAHIDRALADPDGDPIPGHEAYRLAAQSIGGVLLATVGRGADKAGLCIFNVVTRPTQAAKAWRALHAGHPEFVESAGDVPRVPYCAVRAEYGLVLDQGAGAWLDAYQIAIAWAWIAGGRDA